MHILHQRLKLFCALIQHVRFRAKHGLRRRTPAKDTTVAEDIDDMPNYVQACHAIGFLRLEFRQAGSTAKGIYTPSW